MFSKVVVGGRTAVHPADEAHLKQRLFRSLVHYAPAYMSERKAKNAKRMSRSISDSRLDSQIYLTLIIHKTSSSIYIQLQATSKLSIYSLSLAFNRCIYSDGKQIINQTWPFPEQSNSKCTEHLLSPKSPQNYPSPFLSKIASIMR